MADSRIPELTLLAVGFLTIVVGAVLASAELALAAFIALGAALALQHRRLS